MAAIWESRGHIAHALLDTLGSHARRSLLPPEAARGPGPGGWRSGTSARFYRPRVLALRSVPCARRGRRVLRKGLLSLSDLGSALLFPLVPLGLHWPPCPQPGDVTLGMGRSRPPLEAPALRWTGCLTHVVSSPRVGSPRQDVRVTAHTDLGQLRSAFEL